MILLSFQIHKAEGCLEEAEECPRSFAVSPAGKDRVMSDTPFLKVNFLQS